MCWVEVSGEKLRWIGIENSRRRWPKVRSKGFIASQFHGFLSFLPWLSTQPLPNLSWKFMKDSVFSIEKSVQWNWLKSHWKSVPWLSIPSTMAFYQTITQSFLKVNEGIRVFTDPAKHSSRGKSSRGVAILFGEGFPRHTMERIFSEQLLIELIIPSCFLPTNYQDLEAEERFSHAIPDLSSS